MIATTKAARPMPLADIDIVLKKIEAAAMTGDRKAQRDYVMVRGSYLIGCRISELCCLRWQDVEVLPDGSGQIHIHGKGSKVRTVCVSPSTVELFESLGRKTPADWLFPGRNGHITRQAVCDKMRRWGQSVGVHLHPMRLRHSHATHSIQRGCDPFVLQESLGHSSIATTAHYVRANPRESSSLKLS
jgi:site-specific recombinase XerC